MGGSSDCRIHPSLKLLCSQISFIQEDIDKVLSQGQKRYSQCAVLIKLLFLRLVIEAGPKKLTLEC
jgi:hypothetical protein